MLQIWRLGDFVQRKGEYFFPCDLVMIPASISIIWHCVIIYNNFLLLLITRASILLDYQPLHLLTLFSQMILVYDDPERGKVFSRGWPSLLLSFLQPGK